MHTLADVKQELLDHLYKIDKSKMSTADLKIYADTVKVMYEIEKSEAGDSWMNLMSSYLSTGFSPQYKSVDMKEAT